MQTRRKTKVPGNDDESFVPPSQSFKMGKAMDCKKGTSKEEIISDI